MGRYALLVATGEYEDLRLRRLRAPDQDVGRLAAVLEDPDAGGFDQVHVLRDATDVEIRAAVSDLLVNRLHDDLVLLYFSCHGVMTPSSRLYFASANTDLDNPGGTAVPRSFLNEQLEDTLAGGRVLLLDCCFSGAFVEGFKAGGTSVLEGKGKGYVVLTASNAIEYAFEQDTLLLETPASSIFTDVVVEGLSTGAADLGGDGWVDAAELYGYVGRQMAVRGSTQSPQFFAQGVSGSLRIARVGGPRTTRNGSAKPVAANQQQIIVARGFRAAADPVRRTLGPLGRRVVVTGEDGRYLEFGDAAGIVGAFRPDDVRHELGASYVRELVREIHVSAGDGAATAVTITNGMVTGSLEALRAGVNPVRLKRGVEAAAARAQELIAAMAVPLWTSDQVKRVAQSSAANELSGAVVADALDRVGRFGGIMVEENNGFGVEVEVDEGIRIDRGYTSAYFITDTERLEAELDEPWLLVVAEPLRALKDLLPLLEKVMPTSRPLVVLAPAIEGETLATLVVNKIRETLKSVAVSVTDYTDLEDIAAVTGAQVIRRDLGYVLANTDLSMLGRARRVVVRRNEMVVVAGNGTHLREWSDELQRRGAPPERLERLRSGTAAISVGALTDDDRREQRTIFERAVRAVRTAVSHGVVAGGGVALAQVGARLIVEARGEPDEAAGWSVLGEALAQPLRMIAVNGAVDVEQVAAVAARTDAAIGGFDVHTGTFAPDTGSGVIDSAGVVSAVLTAVTRTATRFLLVA